MNSTVSFELTKTGKMIKLTAVFLFCFGTLIAQDQKVIRLDSLFHSLEANQMAMGGISIYVEGKEVYQKSFGHADISNRMKGDRSTQYRIGSITKTFTATLILQLVDEQKLSLDTMLSSFFPQIPNAHKITIEALLKHRSGLFNITDAPDVTEWIRHPQTREQMLDRFVKHGVIFEPNERSEYANTNYILLSYIAEEIEGKSFSDLLAARITRPLELDRTAYGKVIETQNNEALSYFFEDSQWVTASETHLSAPMGAGALVSTPTQLNRFYEHLFNGNLVSKTALAQMKDQSTGMGMGLMDFPVMGMEGYGHFGGIDGFQSVAVYFPKKQMSFTIGLNGNKETIQSILLPVFEIWFAEEAAAQNNATIQLNPEDLRPYLGTYSGSEAPVSIVFSQDGNLLIAQATGQPPFRLVANEKDVFNYPAIGLKFLFSKQGAELVVWQKDERLFKLSKE